MIESRLLNYVETAEMLGATHKLTISIRCNECVIGSCASHSSKCRLSRTSSPSESVTLREEECPIGTRLRRCRGPTECRCYPKLDSLPHLLHFCVFLIARWWFWHLLCANNWGSVSERATQICGDVMTMATTGVMAVAPSPLAFAIHQKHRHSASASAANVSHASSFVSVDLPVRQVSRHVQQRCRCAATSEDGEPSTSGGGNVSEVEGSAVPEAGGRGGENVVTGARRRRRDAPRAADSTDWISSNLTRRFGLGAGLAWVGVLAFGVISEQVKTRNEVFREEQGTRDVEGSKEVTLPNGIRYTELREGGGSTPQRGDLVVVNLTGRVASTGDVFIDTTAEGKRSVAFIFGARPLSGGMCDGVEYVLRSTRVGGKRRVTVPAALGFGEAGTTLGTGITIPGNAALDYVVELQKASIPPS